MAHPFLLMYGGGNEGGAVAYLLHLIRNLDHHQYRPVFVSMGRDDLREAIEGLGLEYHVAKTPPAVARLARAKGARFFHTHGVRANFAGRVAGLLTGIPAVTTVHSMIAMDYTRTPTRVAATMLDNATLRLARRIIAVSGAIARDVIRRGARPEVVRVVYNGIPPAEPASRTALRAELGLDDETVVLFAAARLHPVKGFRYLLDAAAQLEGRLPPWQLLIAGDGPMRDELQRRVRELNLGHRVRLMGHVPNARRLLPAFDVYVSSSLMEGLPLSITEAMAAQVPVVATEVGGVPELLEDGRSGLLVPPADHGALAAAIERMVTEEGLAEALARKAYERYLADFTTERFAERTMAVYSELL